MLNFFSFLNKCRQIITYIYTLSTEQIGNVKIRKTKDDKQYSTNYAAEQRYAHVRKNNILIFEFHRYLRVSYIFFFHYLRTTFNIHTLLIRIRITKLWFHVVQQHRLYQLGIM